MLALLAVGLLSVYLLNRAYIVIQGQLSHDKCLPRLVTTIQPMSALGALLPRSAFHRGLGFPWWERNTLYKNANLKAVTVIPFFYGRDILYTSSLSVFHQCLAFNSPFKKPDMGVLEIMGDNVVTTEGEAWKKHRRITGPAFNHATYRNVWETVARVYEDMLNQEGWRHVDETPAANFNQVTHKLALFLIAIVGFNIPMSWYEPPRDENGRLSVQAMVFEVASYILHRSQLPKWSYSLGFKKLKEIDEAYTVFERFMYERIGEREAQLKKIRAMEGSTDEDIADNIKDVFGRLVNARLADGKYALSDEEIIGNCFVFTFAGHETTANTLVMTLSLLALHPDKQDWVYSSIKAVIGDRTPTFDDYDELSAVLGCFFEGLRMYPAAYMLARVASRDCTLSLPRRDNPDVVEQIFVKKGTPVNLDLIGMLYDPQTFPDPEQFKPERWVKSGKPTSASSITKDTDAGEVSGSAPASTLDGFVGFSFGPRTCLGHKFAKVEGVAFLTLLLCEWRVELALKDGETKEMWKERVMNPSLAMTLTVGEVPLKLVRRK
ncbi:cytochrome P450 [Fomitiporia mediterranea MF3/22]|uniref:cytochrome P450 n=1 Tax=Fomitiporia mediterranea (strain MF3/22) TaxID=694068 RepID=UPI0004407EF8|nr:cytochrome P450 [Fomitiporia mediterranea MF3/22]EJD03280.1 cytochrome P450 [Fomitiporia mediterranea MF3/22]